MDPWWNPAVEEQATARAHRIGQAQTVFVYKLVVEGSKRARLHWPKVCWVAMADQRPSSVPTICRLCWRHWGIASRCSEWGDDDEAWLVEPSLQSGHSHPL
jgi:hypothetical protein